MSGKYRPDGSALPILPWTTIHLANRDLGRLVPINFVTHAGVYLTSACFASGVFEDSTAEKCISNLLAARFEKFIVDLYWNPSVRQFSLCPVSISQGPQPLSLTTSSLTRTLENSETISEVSLEGPSTQSTTGLTTSTTSASAPVGIRRGNSVRQATTLSTLESPPRVITSISPSSIATSSAFTTTTTSSTITIHDISQSQCSPNLNLPFLASLVRDYIGNTSDTISANLLFFQFNLHAVASSTSAYGSAPSRLAAADLPSPTELVGIVFNAATSPLPYVPIELVGERENLNRSWYDVDATEQPTSEYFTLESIPGGRLRTPDGWPSESFAEIRRFNRVLLGWGSIDAQLEDYNLAGDDEVVFPSDYVSSFTDVHSNFDGQIDLGCFYDEGRANVAQSNSSWALSAVNANSSSLDSPEKLWSLAGNLTSCGISPALNVTLGNQTADLNVLPYAQFVQTTVWNWAPGEPRNLTVPDAPDTSGGTDENQQSQFRCALMDTSTSNNASRWRVEDCRVRHRAACRIRNQPYQWRISEDAVPFSTAEFSCQADSTFAVPRTGLENTYLYRQTRNISDESSSGGPAEDTGVWLNFNSIDIAACWVTTGPNGTCPHFVDEVALRQRTVLVPVIAALVVILLTALTLFVKCNKNRRNSRKRVRGEGGWDYEGVPS